MILIIGWLIFFFYAYPGLMTKDSFDHFAQAREGFYMDDHPPIMQALVAITDFFVVGPPGVLILQSVCFLVGVYWILGRTLRPQLAALVACAILLFPPVLAPLTVIWKDCVMAGFLALGIGAMLREGRNCRNWKIAGLAFLTIATALRYNAPAATLPLVVLLIAWKGRWWRRYGLAFAAWLAMTGVAFGINGLLTDRKMHIWTATVAVMDITGTLRYARPLATDAEMREIFAGAPLLIEKDIHKTISKRYQSAEFIHHVYSPTPTFALPLVNARQPAPEAHRDAMYRAWKSVVTRWPKAYMRYRLDTFRVVLGFDKQAWDRVLIVTHPYQDKKALDAAGVSSSYSGLQERIGDGLNWLSHTVLFKPYLYFFLSLAILIAARKHRDIVAIVGGGLALELSLFLLAGSPDFRYSHWMICSTLLGAVLWNARRYAEHA